MKKYSLAFGLTGLLAALALAGCGSGSGSISTASVPASGLTPIIPMTPSIPAVFTGRTFQSTVTLSDGDTASLSAVVDAQNHLTGTVTLDRPLRSRSRVVLTTTPVTGTLDPLTGAFTLSGTYLSNGQVVSINISGTLPLTVAQTVTAAWKVNGVNYSALLTAVLNNGGNTGGNTGTNAPAPGTTTGTPGSASGSTTFSAATGNVTGTSFAPTGGSIDYAPPIYDANDNLIPLTLIYLTTPDTQDGAATLTRTLLLALPPNLAAGTVVNLANNTPSTPYAVGLFESREFANTGDSTARVFGSKDGGSGTVTVLAAQGKTYTLFLDKAHLNAVTSGSSEATGSVTITGTVTVTGN